LKKSLRELTKKTRTETPTMENPPPENPPIPPIPPTPDGVGGGVKVVEKWRFENPDALARASADAYALA
jgi:hypothetical protein